MQTSFQNFNAIVSAALGKGEVLTALVTYAAAGELKQAEEGTAAAICARFGLKKASLSVLQKMPKSTWKEGNRQMANPATTIYTYALALRKCGNDVEAMMALTPSGITAANKPDVEKTPRKAAEKPAAAPVTLTVADALACILTAHKVGALTDADYQALQTVVQPAVIVPIMPRADVMALTH